MTDVLRHFARKEEYLTQEALKTGIPMKKRDNRVGFLRNIWLSLGKEAILSGGLTRKSELNSCLIDRYIWIL